MAPKRLPWSVRARAGKPSWTARSTSRRRWAAPSSRLYSEWTWRWTKSVRSATAILSSGRGAGVPSAPGRLAAPAAGQLDQGHGSPVPEAVLGQPSVPSAEVLLLDEDRGQGGGHLGVVGRLGLALD